MFNQTPFQVSNWLGDIVSKPKTKTINQSYLHCPELGRECAPDPTSDDDGSDHGAELTGERQRKNPANGPVQAQPGELAHELDGEGHAHEGRG